MFPSVWYWVDPPVPRWDISDLEIMLHHLDTFWQIRDQPNIMLLRYEDLLDDLEGQMRYIAPRCPQANQAGLR